MIQNSFHVVCMYVCMYVTQLLWNYWTKSHQTFRGYWVGSCDPIEIFIKGYTYPFGNGRSIPISNNLIKPQSLCDTVWHLYTLCYKQKNTPLVTWLYKWHTVLCHLLQSGKVIIEDNCKQLLALEAATVHSSVARQFEPKIAEKS